MTREQIALYVLRTTTRAAARRNARLVLASLGYTEQELKKIQNGG